MSGAGAGSAVVAVVVATVVSGAGVVAAVVVVVSGTITALSDVDTAGASERTFVVVVVVSALVVAVVCAFTSASVGFLSSISFIVVVSGVFSVSADVVTSGIDTSISLSLSALTWTTWTIPKRYMYMQDMTRASSIFPIDTFCIEFLLYITSYTGLVSQLGFTALMGKPA